VTLLGKTVKKLCFSNLQRFPYENTLRDWLIHGEHLDTKLELNRSRKTLHRRALNTGKKSEVFLYSMLVTNVESKIRKADWSTVKKHLLHAVQLSRCFNCEKNGDSEETGS